MNEAVEIFSQVPRTVNCAQAVAAGLGRRELLPELGSCGGGRAPGGRCGALHAALLLIPERARAAAEEEFRRRAGSVFCREIRAAGKFPCRSCVEAAAELAESALGRGER